MSSPRIFTNAEQFFYDHAGWSHDPLIETEEDAHLRVALILAAAEAEAKSRGWWISIDADPDVMEDDADSVGMVARGEMNNLMVTLWAPPATDASFSTPGAVFGFNMGDPVVLDSLGGIVVPNDRDPYLRVVAAELALGALNEQEHVIS